MWRSNRICVVALGFLLAGCRQDMHDAPYYRPLAKSNYFADGRSARPIVEGTIARGQLRADPAYYTGRQHAATSPAGSQAAAAAASPARSQAAAAAAVAQKQPFAAMFEADLVTEFPFPVTREVILRGQQRFAMFCTPCHGYTGQGNGMVVQRGLLAPPSFHIERLRQAPTGHFFDVITNGYGAMYSYSSRIPVSDRWAIIAYVRTLQRAFSGNIDDVPESERQRLAGLPQDPDIRLADTRPLPDAAAAAKSQGIETQQQKQGVAPSPTPSRDGRP